MTYTSEKREEKIEAGTSDTNYVIIKCAFKLIYKIKV